MRAIHSRAKKKIVSPCGCGDVAGVSVFTVMTRTRQRRSNALPYEGWRVPLYSGKPGQLPKQQSKVFIVQRAISKHHCGLFKDRILAHIHTLLCQIVQSTCQSGALVAVIEYVTASENFCMQPCNPKRVAEPSVLCMGFKPVKGRFKSCASTTPKPRQTT
jgi:hypothetical protein